jgi:hypothetical protein
MERYLDEIVDPIVKDFQEHPDSRRHAFIACVAVFHSIDYLAYPRRSQPLRDAFRKTSPDFAIVDEIAHAFKHVQTDGRTPLKADKVVSHKGDFSNDFSDDFDISKVTVKDRPGVNLLSSVRKAVSFLREYRPPVGAALQRPVKGQRLHRPPS